MAMANPLGHFTCFLDEDPVATAPRGIARGTDTYPRFQRVLGHTFRPITAKGDCWLGKAWHSILRGTPRVARNTRVARRAHELSLIVLARIFLDFKDFLQ